MTARKKTAAPAEQTPVTIAELILAAASYPQDSTVQLGDTHAALVVHVDGEEKHRTLWDPMADTSIVAQRPQHYERPEIAERVIQRSDPMDDFSAAQDFLEWLKEQRYQMPQVSTGGGHNEPTSYRDLTPSELAHEYAAREAGKR